MSDPEMIGRILQKIKKKYDKDPENWKVMGGVDQMGNKDLIISQDPSAFWIKSKTIDPYRSISFGKEYTVKSLDDEIQQEINKKQFNPNDAFHRLFGMAASVSEKDIISAAGIERIAPKEMKFVKNKINEKFPNSEKNLRKKVRKKWLEDFGDRDNVYI